MIPNPSLHWNEILSAYVDGEFEGRDDLAILKQRVEDWLLRHPEVAEELAEIRQLKQLMRDTMPTEPTREAWRQTLDHIQQTPQVKFQRQRGWRRIIAGAVAAAACLALVVVNWPDGSPVTQTPIDADEGPYSVASAEEVEILTVEGADTHTLVVGELPVSGPLSLAAPGDVTLTSVQPSAGDNLMPEVSLQGPGRPMIWARLDTD